MRVPDGAFTVTRVSLVRLPLKRPAMRTTGNGSMNLSFVSGDGVVPLPVVPPAVNVPLPGPLGVTRTHGLPASAPVGSEYGFFLIGAVGSETANAGGCPFSVTVSRARSVYPASASRTRYWRSQAPATRVQPVPAVLQRSQS